MVAASPRNADLPAGNSKYHSSKNHKEMFQETRAYIPKRADYLPPAKSQMAARGPESPGRMHQQSELMSFYRNDGGIRRADEGANRDLVVDEFDRDKSDFELELERIRKQAYDEEMRKLRGPERPRQPEVREVPRKAAPAISFAPRAPAP